MNRQQAIFSALSAIVFLAVHTPLNAATKSSHAVQRPVITEYVTAVASGGYWKDGDRSGIIRIIVLQQGWEHVTSSVYLEWIEERHTRELKLIQQSPVDEINQAGTWSIGAPVMLPSANGLVIRLPATHMDHSRNKTFNLIVPVSGIGNFEVRQEPGNPINLAN